MKNRPRSDLLALSLVFPLGLVLEISLVDFSSSFLHLLPAVPPIAPEEEVGHKESDGKGHHVDNEQLITNREFHSVSELADSLVLFVP